MICTKCGKVINDESLIFCPYCGTEIEKKPEETKVEEVQPINQENVESKEQSEPKVWRVFAKAGLICGIISLATCFFSYYGISAGIAGIVFSILGRKSQLPAAKAKSRVGLVLAIIGTVVGFTLYIAYIIFASIDQANFADLPIIQVLSKYLNWIGNPTVKF